MPDSQTLNVALTCLFDKQRKFFDSGNTLEVAHRKESLKKLFKAIEKKEGLLLEALKSDLNKSPLEAFGAEVGFIYREIKHTLKHLDSWTKPQTKSTPLIYKPAKSTVQFYPLGQTLIISPWNYPIQLALSPLVGAISAGNTAVLKPSEHSPQCSQALKELLSDTFSDEEVEVVLGGVTESQELLTLPWDHIFFTGGTEIGKVVMQAAAKHLSKVTLELGGKSPCLIDETAPLQTTIRRITWGKFFNAGQTCVAPDYLLVPKNLEADIIQQFKKEITGFYSQYPEQSPDYGRIINDAHFNRLSRYLKDGEILLGGRTNASTRYLEPTLIRPKHLDVPVMNEEIFGPLLPLIPYSSLEEARMIIQRHPKPLALYLFSKNKNTHHKILDTLSFGGACVNDTLIHLDNPQLPFGGVGPSGLGFYHGRYSFEQFSHPKTILKRTFFADVRFRYPPYPHSLKWLRKILS